MWMTNLFKKIFYVFVVWIAYLLIWKLFYQVNTTYVVMSQLTNNPASLGELQIQQLLWQASFIIPIVASFYIFKDELIDLYYKITGGF